MCSHYVLHTPVLTNRTCTCKLQHTGPVLLHIMCVKITHTVSLTYIMGRFEMQVCQCNRVDPAVNQKKTNTHA